MGKKLIKTTKMKNPAAPVNQRHKIKPSLDAPDCICFICGETSGGKNIPLLMSCTPYSNIQLPTKIGQLMGDQFMVIVDMADTLCMRCSSLINQLDKLEFEADRVKSVLTEHLKAKYHLSDILDTDEDVLYENKQNTNELQFEEYYEPSSETDELDLGTPELTDVKTSVQDVICDAVSPHIKTEIPKAEECGNLFDDNGCVEENYSYIAVENEYVEENVTETGLSGFVDGFTNTVTLYKCNVCPFETLILDDFVTHMKVHSKKILLHKCANCHQRFETQDDMKQHIMKIHRVPEVPFYDNMRELEDDPDYYPSNRKMYECSTCKFRHNNKKVFDAHLRKHVKSEGFTCCICSKVFKHKVTLKKHMFSHRTYKCRFCSAVFQNEASLSHHFKVHNHNIKVIDESLVQLSNVAEDTVLDMPLSVPYNATKKDEVRIEFELADVADNQADESRFDQVEVLLQKIHADLPEDVSVSLKCAVGTEVCEIPVKGEEVQDSKDIEQNIAVPCSVIENEKCSVSFQDEGQIKQYIDSAENYMDGIQQKDAEGCKSNNEILKVLDDDAESIKENEFLDNFTYIEKVCDEMNKDGVSLNDEQENFDKNSNDESNAEGDHLLTKKVYVCSLCGLKTPSESHIKRHFKCHIAVQKKTYKCHICERVLTTRSNLKRHISLHESCSSGEVQCNMCYEVLTDRLHLKHHMEIKHPESYQCSFCELSYDSKKACREHELTHPSLQCDMCQRMFLTEGRLKSHKLLVHSESVHDLPKTKIFKCHICSKILTTYHNLKRHLRNHEKCSGAVRCVVCNEELADKLHLRQHVEETHPESHQCSFCHKIFANRKSCKAHEMTHPERFVYKCDSCEKLFLTEARLKRHQDIMHRDPHCRVCGKEISNPLKLLDHERRHERHKAMFPCDQCTKVFRTPSGLKYHMSVHTGKYAVYCEICGKGLHSEVVLDEHKATHTKEARYTCEKCGRTFSSNSTYRMHRLWHDNPLPYKCNLCDRKFKHTSILAVHKRRAHTGERPYKCPYCSLTFSVSSTLNKHVILHTKQYPYRCEQCSKGFTTRTKIARHMAKVHNDFEMLNSKKKPCEYKMVLHPSELSTAPKDDTAEPLIGGQILQVIKSGQEDEELEEEDEEEVATLQVLEQVTVDPAQAAIFTIFQQDLPSTDFTLTEFDAAHIK